MRRMSLKVLMDKVLRCWHWDLGQSMSWMDQR